MIRILLSLLASASLLHAQTLGEADRARLAEAFSLADAVGESIWTGWSEVPFAVLLITPDHEFLIRHPRPSDDFVSIGYDDLLGSEVYARPRTGRFALGMLATFPAVGGVNTVVIGQPEATGKSSTLWVITALHEHFHQLQYTRPDYYSSVAALDLAGGDESGMWQLNYPFPYDSANVVAPFMAYAAALHQAVAAVGSDELPTRIGDYASARAALRAVLREPDYRYLSFQLWQEGVARYTEHAVAEAAVRPHRPTAAFQALPDFVSYAAALDTLDAVLENEMTNLDLPSWRRVVFYPLGAMEALLLDATRPGWRTRYFAEKFYLERLSTP